jgi:tetratricopeptide (TPR) repeat protein
MKLLFACAAFAWGAFAFQDPDALPSHEAPSYDKGPDDTSAAIALLNEHKEDEAIKLLQDSLAKNPAAEKPSNLLAQVMLYHERFDEADDVINAAVKAHPDSARLHATRGDIVFREGQVLEADTEYKLAAKLDPKNAEAYFGEARVFDMARLRKTAHLLYLKAFELNRKNPRYEQTLYALEGNSPENILRWQKRLAEPGIDERLAMILTRRIAEAKALNGKPAFELASAYGEYQMPLSLATRDRRILGVALTVAIGKEKTQLEVDTGASGLLVSSRFAKRAGLQRLADSQVAGIGNDVPHKGWVGYAEQMEIGGVQFRNCLVEVSEKLDVNDQDGLIGTDIFRRFFVKINFYTRKLELSPLPGPAWDGSQPVDRQKLPDQTDYVQVFIIGHHLLIPGRISEKIGEEQSPGLFLIDTGSSRNFISTKIGIDVTKMHDDNFAKVRGLGGSVKKVYTADKVVLEFAKFRQANLDMLSVDLTNISRSSGTEVAAMLGIPVLAIFRSITLDYRDGLVKFEYKP